MGLNSGAAILPAVLAALAGIAAQDYFDLKLGTSRLHTRCPRAADEVLNAAGTRSSAG
jgi:hypothetical protein